MKLYKENLIKQASSFLKELEHLNPKHGSLEWYLSNNLQTYLFSIKNADNQTEIQIATKILSRFCTESMDWDTELYKKCTDLTKTGFQLGKEI